MVTPRSSPKERGLVADPPNRSPHTIQQTGLGSSPSKEPGFLLCPATRPSGRLSSCHHRAACRVGCGRARGLVGGGPDGGPGREASARSPGGCSWPRSAARDPLLPPRINLLKLCEPPRRDEWQPWIGRKHRGPRLRTVATVSHRARDSFSPRRRARESNRGPAHRTAA